VAQKPASATQSQVKFSETTYDDLYNKRDKVRKTVCVGVDANCLPSILDNDSEPFILAQDGERLMTQNVINLYQQ
jgi:hypothetical protein